MKPRKIIFCGGGTLGSTTPLLGVFDRLCDRFGKDTIDVLWVRTRRGPERDLCAARGIKTIVVASGKLRRYFSFRNFFDPLLLFVGFVQSLWIVLRFRPCVVINAGSYVGVPMLFASGVLGKKSIALQLDIRPTLSNIMTSMYVERIAASTPDAGAFFSKKKTVVTGIPLRRQVLEWREKMNDHKSVAILKHELGIQNEKPILFITGGGTGAHALNTFVVAALPLLEQHFFIIHLTGAQKAVSVPLSSSYIQFEFLADQCIPALALADIVVSRAGMGTLADCSALAKPLIVIPIPDSHQEANAMFIERNRAGVYLSQKGLTHEAFARAIIRLWRNQEQRKELQENFHKLFPLNGADEVIDLISRV